MRVGFLVTLLLIVEMAAMGAASQDSVSNSTGASSSVITAIAVSESADHVAVEVTFNNLVHPELTTLEHPDRLVFDFRGCELAHPGQRLAINRGAVIAARAAAFSVKPPIARVVIDLKSVQVHEETYVGNKLIITLKAVGGDLSTSATAGKDPAAISSPASAGNRAVDGTKPSGDKSSADRGRNPSVSNPPDTNSVHAYALLDKARSLTVPDLDALEAKARAGDPESETTLALAYHAGTLLKLDDAEALRLLRHAAGRGFVGAEEALGIFSQLGYGMAPDKAQATAWYTKAAQQGSRDAATNLALMYSVGDGVAKDSAKAATWFHTAAEAGDATAQLNIAILYHRGEGVEQDDVQALAWLTKAAEQANLPAMLELGAWDLRPERGNNVDAAIGWYRKAADQGNASAEAALGDIFADKKLGRLDYGEAVKWYRKAAEQGQREGQFGLGARYLFGQGVEQNKGEARRWLTPAADRGHPYAQLLLAKMLEAGDGGPADVAGAEKYYEPAANYGIGEAQYRLGILLASDHNNGRRRASAYKWLVLAEDSVKESAAAALEVRKMLTVAEIAGAEHEIDDWRTGHGHSTGAGR